MEKKSIIVTTPAEDVARVERERIPDTITRETFVKWMEGLVSEITAGGCLSGGDLNKAWNDATFRASRLVTSYKEGRGLFQYEDLSK